MGGSINSTPIFGFTRSSPSMPEMVHAPGLSMGRSYAGGTHEVASSVNRFEKPPHCEKVLRRCGYWQLLLRVRALGDRSKLALSNCSSGPQGARQCHIAGIDGIEESKIEQIMLVQPEMLQHDNFQLRGCEAYNTIAFRHQAILDIERSVNELLDMFVQFAIVARH
jgi:hypothetical protein